jgi:hypothetical protein
MISFTHAVSFACCIDICETLSLTLRGEQRSRVLENRVLTELFGLAREELMKEQNKKLRRRSNKTRRNGR